MEQPKISIEQFLSSKINKKAQSKIGELSSQLFEAEAKTELLQELYNNAMKELEELKGQTPAEPTEPVLSNRARRRQKERLRKKEQTEKAAK